MSKQIIYKTSSGYDTTCDTNTGITSSPLVEDYDENKHEIAICTSPLNPDHPDNESKGGRRRSKKSKKSKKAKKTKKSKKSKKTKKSRKH
jgi:hypothetical protein